MTCSQKIRLTRGLMLLGAGVLALFLTACGDLNPAQPSTLCRELSNADPRGVPCQDYTFGSPKG